MVGFIIIILFMAFIALMILRNNPATAGAANAALFAVALLANEDPALRQRLEAFRTAQTEAARAMALPPAA